MTAFPLPLTLPFPRPKKSLAFSRKSGSGIGSGIDYEVAGGSSTDFDREHRFECPDWLGWHEASAARAPLGAGAAARHARTCSTRRSCSARWRALHLLRRPRGASIDYSRSVPHWLTFVGGPQSGARVRFPTRTRTWSPPLGTRCLASTQARLIGDRAPLTVSTWTSLPPLSWRSCSVSSSCRRATSHT